VERDFRKQPCTDAHGIGLHLTLPLVLRTNSIWLANLAALLVLMMLADFDAVEPLVVIDEDPLAFGQNGVVGGVPRDPETLSDTGHGQVLNHHRLECPPQPAT